jgi:serine/threonine protein kinase
MAERPDPDAQMANERLGRVLGTWTLERVLGVGGMAAVYEGVGPDGARAALKVLHPEMSRRPELRQRFAQEGAAASRVDHPGVVRVLGNGEEPDGTAYLVLELLEGEPLGTILRRDGPFPIPRLLDVLDQVLDVLAVAHARGIIHRDLKPDNLFVTKDHRIKVLDFGIARMLEDVPGKFKTRTGVAIGTVPFMSPEQALGKRDQVDGRSDLFSLGAMIFRIVARRNVHEAESDADLLVAMGSKPAPPLGSVAPDVPQGLAAIVDVALAFSKDSRYPDASIMQADVRAFAAGKAPPYATRLRRVREMATRIDLASPFIDATPSPSPSLSAAKTEPLAALPEPAPPHSHDLWPEPLDSDPAPVSSSRRVMSVPAVPDLVHTAPAAETALAAKMPVHAELKDGPTLVSNAPPALPAPPLTPSSSPVPSRVPLWIGGVLIAIASAGTAYYFARSADDAHANPAPQRDPGPAAPAPHN